MTAEKSKRKNGAGPEITPDNLLILCRMRGMTVADLARKICRSRQTVYFAVENPRRYSISYKLIAEALA